MTMIERQANILLKKSQLLQTVAFHYTKIYFQKVRVSNKKVNQKVFLVVRHVNCELGTFLSFTSTPGVGTQSKKHLLKVRDRDNVVTSIVAKKDMLIMPFTLLWLLYY